MALTAGVISLVSSGSTTANLSVTPASGGTGPYTQQWYKSTQPGFTPGGGNIITGATGLTLADSGNVPNSEVYYEVVFTDTGNSNATVDSTQLGVTMSASTQGQNVFSQSPTLGMTDMKYNTNTIPCQVDTSQSGNLYPGDAVKIVNSAGGVPKVVGCTAATDQVFGFINFNIKNAVFVAGMPVEISQTDNVIYLYATSVIARGAQVQLAPPAVTRGSVTAVVGSSGANLVGWAFDQAPASGALIRVRLKTPNFAFA